MDSFSLYPIYYKAGANISMRYMKIIIDQLHQNERSSLNTNCGM